MPRKSYTPEQIIRKLREAEVLIAEGMITRNAARQIGVTEQTYYRWRKEYGGMKVDQAKRLKALEKENSRLKRLVAEKELDIQILKEAMAFDSKNLSPAKRRRTVEYVLNELSVSERRACKVLDIYRSSHRYSATTTDEENVLLQRITELTTKYGYRRITAMLQYEGWKINHKRVERLWRQEGLKVPQRQPKRGRLWLNDGSCVRLRPLYRNHVWSYDFVQTRTHDSRIVRLLTIIDEYTRECLAIEVGRKLTNEDVLDRLTSLFACRGIPEHIRSDNGSEFTAKAVR